jgi:hypothetical protein
LHTVGRKFKKLSLFWRREGRWGAWADAGGGDAGGREERGRRRE